MAGMAGNGWKSLELLEMARNGLNWLEIAEIAGNC